MKRPNEVVVAYLDGRRMKGIVYNFSVENNVFNLFPFDDPLQARGTKMEMKDLKAIFFVKHLVGYWEDYAPPTGEPPVHGRLIEITFSDGENILGRTEAYSPHKLGFFIFPTDTKSNNLRIFVINKNVAEVRFR
jgi:hypothetical protein